jgi:hypothetical protein
MMTYEKALRILPSFAKRHAEGHTDLARLKRNVEVEYYKLGKLIMEKLAETHSSFRTAEIRDIDRKRDQLLGFLEQLR